MDVIVRPGVPIDHSNNIPEIDRKAVWHPFTSFNAWGVDGHEITVIKSGEGCHLTDTEGRTYLDGNSSIWVNIHGHRCKAIDQAIRDQLDKIAHSSFLGLTNDVAPQLAEELISLSNGRGISNLARVFFSDDGSTAIEAAIKIIIQRNNLIGEPKRSKFVSLDGGYHGDTVGAMSVGRSTTFHGVFSDILFEAKSVMAPFCYRCPYNKAEPQKADARTYRVCNWECVSQFKEAVDSLGDTYAGTVVEPLVQGAAGMIMHPEGYLDKIATIVKSAGGKLILDEVMTGFYRTGSFMAFHQERIQPDIVALAKGLTGGYLPLAATLVTDEIFEPFNGGPDKTFYHGHSYSGNQLGCAAARANLKLLCEPGFMEHLNARISQMRALSNRFWEHPNVGDVRQTGLILAIELVEAPSTRKAFPRALRTGWKIAERAKYHGLLARSLGDVLLIMPPLVVTDIELETMVEALFKSLCDILPITANDAKNR